MYRAYIDDSGMNQAPVSILAGWLAPTEVWRKFEKDWTDVLQMSPRIQYFKFVEAINSRGEFNGISDASKKEKLLLLGNCIADHDLLGVNTIVPHDIFHEFFGPTMCDGPMKHPYVVSFAKIINRIHIELIRTGKIGKVEFIFDEQRDQLQKALTMWDVYSEGFRGFPSADVVSGLLRFANDREEVGLQAADLHAGWARQQYAAVIEGRTLPRSLWSDKTLGMKVINWVMDREVAQQLASGYFGED